MKIPETCPQCDEPLLLKGEGWGFCDMCVCEITTEDVIHLFDIENNESGITSLYAERTPDGWLYTIIRHHFGKSYILWQFRNGEIIYGMDSQPFNKKAVHLDGE